MKQPSSIATLPGWEASPTPDYPQAFRLVTLTVRWYTAIIFLVYLAQEPNTMTPASTRTRIARSF